MHDEDSWVRRCATEAIRESSNHHVELIKSTKLIGLISAIAYMIVILFTWAYANLQGYVYFSAGEPNFIIKVLEWALGFIGIFTALYFLRKELIYITCQIIFILFIFYISL